MTTRNRQQPDAKTALATRRENGDVAQNPLADEIRKMEKQFQLAMPKGAEAVQLVRDALTLLRTTAKLSECESTSVLGGLMTCAQLGLRPGVLGQAWLLPFWDRKSQSRKAQLVIGYQGLIELAYRTGQVASVYARTVYDGELFDVDYGVANSLVHKPNLDGDTGEPVAYYAVVKYVNNGYGFFVMPHRQMERHRDRHATARSKDGRVVGPWVDHFEGMAHKTVLRQLAKWMPKSVELATALQVDEGVRLDISGDPAEATQHDVWDGEILDPEPEPNEQPATTDGGSAGDWPATAVPGGDQ